MVLEALAEAELGCGRPRLARAAADLASAAAETLQLDLPHAVALRAHATIELARGRQRARGRARRWRPSSARRGPRRGIETERTRVLAGQALAAAGRRAEAVAELQAAAEQLEACGARRLAEAARGAADTARLDGRVTPLAASAT